MEIWPIHSNRASLAVTAEGGHLDAVCFETDRGRVRPMRVAPWAAEALPADTPPILRILRGDFFCAPFGASDVLPDEPRIHGTPANGPWRLIANDGLRMTAELEGLVSGARIRKHVFVRHGHAVIYQQHELIGGSGRIPIGHHAMLRAPETLLLAFSPWCCAATPPIPLEGHTPGGRSLLRYPQELHDLTSVALAAGGTADVSRFPALAHSDDLLMLSSRPDVPFAWSAATAPSAGWLWFDLRNPRELAGTVLWMSHGGRDYPPWNGRHTHVIGIEHVTACFNLGHRASISENPLTARGIPTSIELRPEATAKVHYAFGVVAVPHTFGRVRAIEPASGGVRITDERGTSVFAPVDADFVLDRAR